MDRHLCDVGFHGVGWIGVVMSNVIKFKKEIVTIQDQIDMLQKLADEGVVECCVVALRGNDIWTGWSNLAIPLLGALSVVQADMVSSLEYDE